MQDPQPAQTLEPMHTVPTHLDHADTVLSLGTFSLSSRQFLLLLCGGSVCATLWTHTTVLLVRWLPPLGAILHGGMVFLLTIGVLALTFGQVQGRSLESWLLVIALYLARPRLSLWRSLCRYSSWPLAEGRGEGEAAKERGA
jgi:hypothetical protein